METKAQKNARMAWWRGARFGMFIHWGLYAIPAGKWGNGVNYGEWLREEAHVPVGEYEKLAEQFNPVKFNADEWVRMAKDAGMKYVVITTKHHDGFNLFQTPYSDWSISRTPFGRKPNPGPPGSATKGRDVMEEMAAATRKAGLKMGWYHSIMDWHHPDYLPRRAWEVADRPAGDANMDRYVQYLRDEVSYLLTHYGPIGVMWFDGEWESTWDDHYGRPLYELCRTLQPSVIVNNRVSNSRGGAMGSGGEDQRVGDYSTPEQTIPATGLNVDWETCMTMNAHWGFNEADKEWKSSRQLIRNLVDIVSKGGNYLLNIGPRADGTFPPQAVSRLRDIGRWMEVNGESIYETTASSFEHLPWGRSTTRAYPQGMYIVYLHVLDWPKDGRLVVPGLANTPVAVRILGVHDLQDYHREGPNLVVSLPKAPLDLDCTVVSVVLNEAPVVYQTPKILSSSDQLVDSLAIDVQSPKGMQVRYTVDGQDPKASSALWQKPLRITSSTEVRAAGFSKGQRVTAVAVRKFAKVKPWAPTVADNLAPGLHCDVYEGDWDRLPDFRTLKPVRQFNAPEVKYPAGDGVVAERVGMRYSGYLQVPADALYEFALLSDDGSKLWIDDKLVVDNDGLHSSETKLGHVPLAKGFHRIRIGYFNKTGSAALSLRWATLGDPLRRVNANSLSTTKAGS